MIRTPCFPAKLASTTSVLHSILILALASPVCAGEAHGPAPGRQALKQATEVHVLGLVTEGSGKLRQFQSVDVAGLYLAQLDGEGPPEAIVRVCFYVGEGCRDLYLAVYSLANHDEPRLVTCKKTHGEHMEPGHCEIVDLDGDGRDEILVVGDTCGIAASDLRVYSLRDGRLKDMVWGPDCGVAYFHLDLDGDGGREIVALAAREGEDFALTRVVVLKRDERGYYREVQPNLLPGEVLVRAFEETVSAGRLGRPEDLRYLAKGIRLQGKAPRGIETLQPKLEELFRRFHKERRYPIVDAMAWPGNARAVPFLENLVASDGYGPTRAAAAEALAVVSGRESAEPLFVAFKRELGKGEGKFDHNFMPPLLRAMLSVGDRRGLELAVAKAKAPDVPVKLRRDLIYWVLGEVPFETESVLSELAENSRDSEIRRVAEAALLRGYWKRRRQRSKELQEGLRSPDPNVRASTAMAAGELGIGSSLLLKALEMERERGPRRQMVMALCRLRSMEAVGLFPRLLPDETDNQTRELMRSFIVHRGIERSEEEVLQGLGPDVRAGERWKMIEHAGRLRITAAVPHIIRLVRENPDYYGRPAAKALGWFDLPEAKTTLRELATHTEWRTRSAAIRSLGRLKDAEAEELLLRAFEEDPEAIVRDDAALALGYLGTEKALGVLIGGLQQGLRHNAHTYIVALVSTGAPEAREALARELARLERPVLAGKEKDVGRWVLIALADGLRKMGDPRGLAAMSRWAGPGYPADFRASVIERLAKSGDPVAVQVARKYEDDESRDARVAVISALQEAGQ